MASIHCPQATAASPAYEHKRAPERLRMTKDVPLVWHCRLAYPCWWAEQPRPHPAAKRLPEWVHALFPRGPVALPEAHVGKPTPEGRRREPTGAWLPLRKGGGGLQGIATPRLAPCPQDRPTISGPLLDLAAWDPMLSDACLSLLPPVLSPDRQPARRRDLTPG